MKTRLNIGLIIGRFPPDYIGGAELQARQVAQQLTKNGHQVVVFTRRYNQRPYIEEIDGYFIRRRNELPVGGLRMLWDTFPAVWNIAHQHPRPDVLFCYQTLNSGLIGMVAQALLKIPMVLSVRGNREYRLQNSTFQRLVVPPIFRRARRVIVQSAYIRKDMIEQLQLAGQEELAKSVLAKTVVIPNGIKLPDVKRSNGNKIIYVGRLIRNKGVADLIEGIRQLPEHELLIVGDGPDRERLEALARGMPVTFTGQVLPSMVIDYLQRARVLVLPSHLGDGLPNVILEAMGCGVPVVATRTAGIPDLVQHGETGYLFEKGDVQQMTSAIDRLMKDDELWNSLGERSLKAIRSFSWDNIVPQIEQNLASVIKQSSQPQ